MAGELDLEAIEKRAWSAIYGYEYIGQPSAAEEIRALVARVRELEALLDAVDATIGMVKGQNATLRSEQERLRAALSWYADKKNWSSVQRRFMDGTPVDIVHSSDGGERARAALAETEGGCAGN